ncbi:hypothetical protein RB653_001174 [Dictyostelium firmibasis]|uniref:Phospholipase B-like n=1 Tax=Dictyostelium firmibasis TaxID=79012 RepID=A0AAN7U7Y2_9MYCE
MVDFKYLLNSILIIFMSINLIYCMEIKREEHLKILNELNDNSDVIQYSILKSTNGGEYEIVKGIQDDSIVYGYYMPNVEVNGWAYLSLVSNDEYNDSVQSRAFGYLEGYLTKDLIWNSKVNYYMNAFNSTKIPNKLDNWLTENIESINTFSVNNKHSQYWKQINLIMDQINGMVDGYNDANSNKTQTMSLHDFFVLNMFGDLFDLMPALNLDNEYQYFKKDLNDIQDWFKRTQHCSALIKVTSDYSELYSGHTTWSGYSTMLRIFKSYYQQFSSDDSGTISKRNIFSGYPGALTSIDDFYLMSDTRMVVIETTNSLITNDLYHLIRPTSVLSWMRVIVSNRMSTNGKEWSETFQLYNSGTYNNQWMIISYNLFIPYQELKDGALYILEQIPGYIEFSDQTQALRQGWWNSYNIPFYEKIYDASGYNNYTANNYSDSTIYYMSYQTCPRAEIFRNFAGYVESLEDFQALLRYNDFENDPLSHDTPFYSIASRYDLLKKNPSPFGATDTKVTSNSMIDQNIIVAISGPTTSNGQPIFEWDSNIDFMKSTSHLGCPEQYNFPWVSFSNTTYRNIN